MTTDTRLPPEDIAPPRPAPPGLLWGMFGAPAVWLVHFATIYGVVALACWSGFARSSLLGLGAAAAAALGVSAVALALVSWAGRTAYRAWRASREGAEVAEWHRYAGLAGALLSGLFSAAIVLETVPVLVLAPCATL